MSGDGATLSWISTTPVKGTAVQEHDTWVLGETGLVGDRRFHLVDETGRMVNAKRLATLITVQADFDADSGVLALTIPGGDTVAGEVELGDVLDSGFFGAVRGGREVVGPWAQALSEFAGVTLRLAATTNEGAALDREADAPVSLLSEASLARLADVVGLPTVDRRRFRMGLGVAGVGAHDEEEWFGRRVRIGEAVVVPHAHIGRCAVTKLDPATAAPTLDTLAAIKHYRGEIESEEPLPFGVQARVVVPGRVTVGDTVTVE